MTLSQFFAEGNLIEVDEELKELFDDWRSLTEEQKKAVKVMINLHFGLFLGLLLCSIITSRCYKRETRKKTTRYCGLFAILKPFFSISCVWLLKRVLR